MTNRRFVSLVLSIPVVAGLLIGSCVDAASAAEAPTFRLPGGCVTTTELVTHKDGSQQIVRHTRCEYTQAQRDRMAKTGR